MGGGYVFIMWTHVSGKKGTRNVCSEGKERAGYMDACGYMCCVMNERIDAYLFFGPEIPILRLLHESYDCWCCYAGLTSDSSSSSSSCSWCWRTWDGVKRTGLRDGIDTREEICVSNKSHETRRLKKGQSVCLSLCVWMCELREKRRRRRR